MLNHDSYIVTVRSTGERTKDACIQSVLNDGIDEPSIQIINETPFKKALETCFRTAIEKNVKWLLTIDADMIIVPGTLQPFFEAAEQLPDHFLQVQGKIIDKFTGMIRKGGPRIYRVRLLKKALELSESLEDHIRPESRIISIMGDLGYPSRYISPIICLHDFEQYYSDVYRKSYVHAVKHEKNLSKILTNAARHKDHDADYRIILKAVYDSLSGNSQVKIDKRILADESNQALDELGLTEKKGHVDQYEIEKLIKNSPVRNGNDSFKNLSFKDFPIKKSFLGGEVIKKNLRSKGVLNGSLYLLGLILIRIGKYFQRNK